MSILQLSEIERSVCDVCSHQLGLPRNQVHPGSRLIEDLRCDSLDLVELIMEIEETFGVEIPNDSKEPVYKAVFTRQPFRLSDLAELVHLQQGSVRPSRPEWSDARREPPSGDHVPFTQLGGRCNVEFAEDTLFEPIGNVHGFRLFRRRTDGMRCIEIPRAVVEIGDDSIQALADEQPCHSVTIDAFLIDAEPISTTAFCRFLNSIGDVAATVHQDWFVLDSNDRRNQHVVVRHAESEWIPIDGTEKWPMVLVSWFGANAYSRWANGFDWRGYRDDLADSFLPTEAQWEYAARGPASQPYPCGAVADSTVIRCAQHVRRQSYRANTMPLANVNELLGMSPLGLHHMAGNVWQWCRDWYDEGFYSTSESCERNAVNSTPTLVRSERGGSWIGPVELCRSSYRRGRPPIARGRCLGFRCISRPPQAR